MSLEYKVARGGAISQHSARAAQSQVERSVQMERYGSEETVSGGASDTASASTGMLQYLQRSLGQQLI